jgi:hypothetical protein
MLVTSMLTSTLERRMSSSSMSRVPLQLWKRPWTFDTIRWRTEKLTEE